MAKGTIGGKIVLEGASKYNSDLKSIKTNLTELRSEMKLVDSQYSNTANSAEALTKKHEIYAKEVEQVSKRVDTYADMVEAARKMQEKATDQIDKYAKELEEAQKQLDNMKRSGDATNEELEEQEKVVQTLTGKLDGANKAYETAGQKIQQYTTAGNNAKAELNKLNKELDQNDKYLDEANRSADGCAKSIDEYGREVDEAGDKTSRFGDIVKGSLAADAIKAGLKLLVDGIKNAATAALEAGSNFEAGMDKVAAISGATGEELDALAAKAEEMGAKTMFSATESADALAYMAMAGWKTEEMLEGIEPVMNLAAASGSDLATVSDILTDDLTAFGLSAKDAGHFADVLAAASANANTNVELLGETFKYAAPVAGALGYSLEDISVAAGLMANAGIKASSAGTALRSIMTRMAKPTKESAEAMEDLGISLTDSEGKMYTFQELMVQLRGSFDGLTESEKAQYAAMLAGKNAMSGLLAVVNSTDADFEKLTTAIQNSNGAAKDMADTMQDNLKGKVTILQSALEGLGIAAEKIFDQDMKDAVSGATEAVDRLHDAISNGELGVSLSKMSDSLGDFLKNAVELGEQGLPVLINALTWLLDHSGAIISAIGGFMAAKVVLEAIEAWKAFKTALELATIAQEGLNFAQAMNPAGAIAIAIGALTGVIGGYIISLKDAEEEVNKYSEAVDKSRDKINDKIEADKNEVRELEIARDTIRELQGLQELDPAQKQEMKIAVEKLNEAYQDWNLQIGENGKLTEESAKQFDNYIDKLVKEFEIGKKQEELNTIMEEMYEQKKQLAEVTEQHEAALLKEKDAQEELDAVMATLNEAYDNIALATEDYAQALVDAQNEVESTQAGMDALNAGLAENQAKFDETAQAIETGSAAIAESTENVTGALETTSEAVGGFAGAVGDYWALLTEEEQKALEKMAQDVEDFDGLFGKMKTTTETTAEDVAENLRFNAEAMNEYASNVDKAVELAKNAKGDSADATRAIVTHLIDMGIDGAAELAVFVQAAEEDSNTYHEILANFGDLEAAKTSVEQKYNLFAQAFATGYQDVLDEAETKNGEYIKQQDECYENLYAAAVQHKDDTVNTWADTVKDSAQAVKDNAPELESAVGDTMEAWKNTVEDFLDYDGNKSGYFDEIGINTTKSLATGVINTMDDVIDAGADMTQGLTSVMESELGIDGWRSSVFAGYGDTITMSLADSIRAGAGDVGAAVRDLCSEAVNSFDLSGLTYRIESEIAAEMERQGAVWG